MTSMEKAIIKVLNTKKTSWEVAKAVRLSKYHSEVAQRLNAMVEENKIKVEWNEEGYPVYSK